MQLQKIGCVVKIDILNSKCNLRPGDFIRTIYPAINSRISAFKFGLHPRAGKIFKYGKRKRELEEQCVEEWSRKKKEYGGYLKPTTFEVPKPSSKICFSRIMLRTYVNITLLTNIYKMFPKWNLSFIKLPALTYQVIYNLSSIFSCLKIPQNCRLYKILNFYI